jgi:hypothetical protein
MQRKSMGGPRLTCSEHRWECTRLRAGGVKAGRAAVREGVVGEGVDVSMLSHAERVLYCNDERVEWETGGGVAVEKGK